MPVYRMLNTEFETRDLFIYFHVDTQEVRILTIKPDDNSEEIVESCVLPEALFRMQHRWLGNLNTSNEIPNGVRAEVAGEFKTSGDAAEHLLNVTKVRDERTLPLKIREDFAVFHLIRKKVRENVEHELEEREWIRSFWGVEEAEERSESPILFSDNSSTIFNTPPSQQRAIYGPPLPGQDWPVTPQNRVEIPMPQAPRSSRRRRYSEISEDSF